MKNAILLLTILGSISAHSAYHPGCKSIKDLGAKSHDESAGFDNTSIIQGAIDQNSCVFIPEGVYWIKISKGLVLRTGVTVVGAGSQNSILVVKDRATGSVFKREWNPNVENKGDNPFVTDITLEDFGILLNHANYNAQNPKQIGVNFSHISGSFVKGLQIGNMPFGASVPVVEAIWTKGKQNFVQGVGILICSISSGHKAYAGGERNRISDVKVWGARKGIGIDDQENCFSTSGTHGTVVTHADIQAVAYGITQESRYTAGTQLKYNTVQDLVPAGSTGEETSAYIMNGYGGQMEGAYMEFRDKSNRYAIQLGVHSLGNDIRLGYLGVGPETPGATVSIPSKIKNQGTKNKIFGFDRIAKDWITVE